MELILDGNIGVLCDLKKNADFFFNREQSQV